MTEEIAYSLVRLGHKEALFPLSEAGGLGTKRTPPAFSASAPEPKRARIGQQEVPTVPSSGDAGGNVQLDKKCGLPTKNGKPCLHSKQCSACGFCHRHCPCDFSQQKKCGFKLKTGAGCSRRDMSGAALLLGTAFAWQYHLPREICGFSEVCRQRACLQGQIGSPDPRRCPTGWETVRSATFAGRVIAPAIPRRR
eukprot:scaffold3233_cov394-Pinguiococcus_pyrenoidosus.AAC.1